MQKKEYTITVYTENQVGLLNRIAIIFSRRKINIEILNTSPTEVDSVHRFTIVRVEFYFHSSHCMYIPRARPQLC